MLREFELRQSVGPKHLRTQAEEGNQAICRNRLEDQKKLSVFLFVLSLSKTKAKYLYTKEK